MVNRPNVIGNANLLQVIEAIKQLGFLLLFSGRRACDHCRENNQYDDNYQEFDQSQSGLPLSGEHQFHRMARPVISALLWVQMMGLGKVSMIRTKFTLISCLPTTSRRQRDRAFPPATMAFVLAR